MQDIITKIKTKTPSKKGAFLSLFGISFIAFATGFDDCLFDLDTVDECVAYAESWVEPFAKVGDHLIKWMIAIFKAVFT